MNIKPKFKLGDKVESNTGLSGIVVAILPLNGGKEHAYKIEFNAGNRLSVAIETESALYKA